MTTLKEIPIWDASHNTSTIYDLPEFAEAFEGTLDNSHDEDWIRVELTAGREYEINLQGIGDNGVDDTIIKLYNADGEMVAMNDDIDTAGGNLNSMVMFTPDTDGAYYISASSYNGNPNSDSSGDYVITVSGFGGTSESLASYRDSDMGVEVAISPGEGIIALQGSMHDDILTGDENDNWLFANGGSGFGGEDKVNGGAGNDWLFAGSGYVVLEGGKGADYIVGVDDALYIQGFELASYEISRTSVFVDLGAGTATGGDAEGDVLVYIDGLIGSANGDDLTGNELGNELWGGAGDDILNGGGTTGFYYDYMEGGPGADELIGGDGRDYAGYTESEEAVEIRLHDGTIKGGDAEGDTYHGIDSLIGSEHDDILAGDDDVNWLNGGNGSDVLEGRAGDDFIFGDAFADIEGGNDIIDGGEGNDLIAGAAGSNVIMGGPGVDFVLYSDNPEGIEVNLAEGTVKNGWGGVDSLHDIENIRGSLHDDILIGDEANNFLSGEAGNDVIHGGMGNDFVQGAEGDDEVHGQDGDDEIYGDYYGSLHGETTGGDDKLYGGKGDDRLHGRVGNDELYGGEGNDFLHAEPGDDMLDGGEGNDYLYGGPGADTLIGGDGIDYAAYEDSNAAIEVRLHDNTALGGYAEGDSLDGIERVHGSNYDDTIEGDHNENALHGFDGNDVLDGREGNDWFEGGEGDDTFIFVPGNGYDNISDFGNGEDRIDLSAFENIESVSDLTIRQDGNDALIDLSDHGGGDISLEGYTEALVAEDFIFAS